MEQQTFFETPRSNRIAGAVPIPAAAFECGRCGFQKFIDTPIHCGRSVRWDCARCGSTAGFPVWYAVTDPNIGMSPA